MWKSVTRDTPLFNDIANEFFSDKISGGRIRDDVTLVSTMRALLHKRIGKGQIRIFCETIGSEPGTNCAYLDDMYDLWEFNGDSHDDFMIQNVSFGTDSENKAYMKLIVDNFEKDNEGWKQLKDITNLFQKSFGILCFVNEKRRCTFVVIEKMTMQKLHYMQCAVLGMVPWYFCDKVLTEDEKGLIYSLREESPDKYLALINKISGEFNFESQRIRKLLTGICTRFETKQLDTVRNNIQKKVDDINTYNTRIGNLISEINTLNITLIGLEEKINRNEGDDEIIEYFSRNKHVRIDTVSGDTIQFVCFGYLDFYDQDIARRYINNPASFVYTRYGGDNIPAEDIKKLMTACFIDEKIKIRMCAKYKISMSGNYEALSNVAFSDDFADSYMPNPHLQRFSCLGNYSRVINEYLRNGDYIGAIEQCGASCRSLSWADSSVMKEFIKSINGCPTAASNNRAFELPDGSVVTPKEAIKWLKEGN